MDAEAMRRRQEEIRQEQTALSNEETAIRYALFRLDDAPLVGRFFKRDRLSRGFNIGDGWAVWTRVDRFDGEMGARGVEFRKAAGDWYDVKLNEHVTRAEVGDEITEAEFYAAIAPLLERLSRAAPSEHGRDGE